MNKKDRNISRRGWLKKKDQKGTGKGQKDS